MCKFIVRELRRTEEVWYRIELTKWAIDRANVYAESKAVTVQFEKTLEQLQTASERLSNVSDQLPEDQRIREEFKQELHENLRTTEDF